TSNAVAIRECDGSDSNPYLGNHSAFAGVEFDLVDKEDEDLLAMVESNVDHRLVKYQESLSSIPVRPEFVNLFGFALYGGADTPRESPVRHGMEYFQREQQ